MQSLRRPSPGKPQTWVGLSDLLARGPQGAPEDGGGRKGCGPCPKQLIAAPFPEAEAVPASLSYEELVRRNVVGLRAGEAGAG